MIEIGRVEQNVRLISENRVQVAFHTIQAQFRVYWARFLKNNSKVYMSRCINYSAYF